MERQLVAIQPLLDFPFIRRIRRNHGLEHATIHMLAAQIKDLQIVGRSDDRGFVLIGDVDAEQVEECVRRALTRMKAGEHQLALHPNCGTNLLTIAALGSVAALIAMIGSSRESFWQRLNRIPLMMLGIMGAVVFGQPLGMTIQRYITTLGDPADLQVTSVKRIARGPMTIHRVETWSS